MSMTFTPSQPSDQRGLGQNSVVAFLRKHLKWLGFGFLLLLCSNEADATVWLTVKNTGCQTMKVYKASLFGENYQTTLDPNGSWTTLTVWNEQFVYRKTDGTWLGSYTTTILLNQTDNFNAGGAPTAPVVGNISQPTCTTITGGVSLSGLPSSGSWTLTRSPGNVTTTGTGTSTTINGLAPGTYTFTVKNATGCTSPASGNVAVNAVPNVPSAPTVGAITNPSCTAANGSVALSGLPAGGTWTLTRNPGSVNTTGTGTTTMVTGLAAGTYTFKVTSAAGCTSSATGNVVLTSQTYTPGSACNDGNPNTSNDIIQSDGCTCAGTSTNTPNCTTGITITTGSGNITVAGLNGAPITSLQVFNSTWQSQYSCFANCGASQTVNVAAGSYYVIAKYYTASYALICEKQQTVTVSGNASPCANQGGDSDGDGICNNTDCAPNNAALPAPPGTTCDDGNPNTTNDIIQVGGCTCAGTAANTPNCTTGITITAGTGNITVAGLNGAPISSLQVFSSTWQQLYNCFANCGASQTVNVAAGSYYVIAKYYTAGYALICEKQQTVTVANTSPCANQGGDTDGDGVCNNTDCAPNNAALPAPPGTTCNDGNPNTTNDVIQTGGCTCAGTPIAQGTLQPPVTHPKFVNQLPAPPRINATNGGTYNISMDEGSYYMGLTDSNGNPMNTTAWGYTYNGVKMHLGPTFVTMKNVPVDVRWSNNLNYGHTHLLPIDHTIHMAHPALGIPTVAHLHGGHTEPASDGHPEAWFTRNFLELGPSWQKDLYHYSLDQEGSMLWYHDHALGFTRLNVYAGLAGMWLHRDQNELSLNLPSGSNEREIVVQDKMFSPNGQLFFPSDPGDPLLPNPSIMPEFFGDYIMVNGMVWPVLDVTPSKYRFRVVNGSDSRVYLFKLSNGASFKQIGTDGGLLNSPVTLTELLLAPGERADLIIDFSGMAGQQIVLKNFGPDGPFQGIDPLTALPIGGAADPATTGQIMMFRVGQQAGTAYNVPNALRQPIQFLGAAQNTRQVLLFEGVDEFGRILPSLGTVANGQLGWIDPVTETPKAGEVEIWEIYNTTMDAHPIHLHQVFFEVMDRQEFMATQDPVTGALTNIMMMGAPIAPAANEKGWKDTAVNLPMQRTRYKVKFSIPGDYVWHCHILSHEDHDMMRPLLVQPATGGGGGGTGTPNCASIHIMPVTGGISVTGLDGAPITSLEIFTANWQPYFSCFGNCGASKVVNVPVGTFYVKAKYFSASYQPLCEVNQTVNVTSAITSTHSERVTIASEQYQDHVTVFWSHNMGDMTDSYVLEHSVDGVNFEPLEAQDSRGGHSMELYNGFDFQPATGENFYRVRMVRLDGTFRYSDVVTAHFDDITDYLLFPNPASDFVQLNLEAVVGAKDVSIKLVNNLGILQKEFKLDEVYGKYYQMDIRNLHEGYYTVWVDAPGKRSVARPLAIGKI